MRFLIILYLLCPYLLCAQSLMEVKIDTIYSEALSQVRSFRVALPTDMPSDNFISVEDARAALNKAMDNAKSLQE